MITLAILSACASMFACSGQADTPAPPAPTVAPALKDPAPFQPYKAPSLYNTRGGLDPYPKPAKPRGYIDIYHPKTKSAF